MTGTSRVHVIGELHFLFGATETRTKRSVLAAWKNCIRRLRNPWQQVSWNLILSRRKDSFLATWTKRTMTRLISTVLMWMISSWCLSRVTRSHENLTSSTCGLTLVPCHTHRFTIH